MECLVTMPRLRRAHSPNQGTSRSTVAFKGYIYDEVVSMTPVSIRLQVNRELFSNADILHCILELIERELTITILVSTNDLAINKLLELNLAQIVADHHFHDLEEITIGNVPILIHIIDGECELEL